MADREKVIETLESCVAKPLHRKGDKFVISFDVRFVNAIIELLKEQKATEPKQVDLYDDEEWWGPVCVCPNCKEKWMSYAKGTHFCPNCGQAVKWE